MEHDLTIIPVLNKIDLPGAEPEKYAAEIGQLVGVDPDEVLRASGKTGQGVPDLLDHVVVTLPPPQGREEAPCRRSEERRVGKERGSRRARGQGRERRCSGRGK